MGGEAKPRLSGRLHSLLDGALGVGQSRLQLLGVEIEEEKLRIVSLLFNAILAAVLLGAALIFLVITLTVAWWDEHRLLALGLATAALLAGGLLTASRAAGGVRQGSHMFAGSLAELKRDRDALRQRE